MKTLLLISLFITINCSSQDDKLYLRVYESNYSDSINTLFTQKKLIATDNYNELMQFIKVRNDSVQKFILTERAQKILLRNHRLEDSIQKYYSLIDNYNSELKKGEKLIERKYFFEKEIWKINDQMTCRFNFQPIGYDYERTYIRLIERGDDKTKTQKQYIDRYIFMYKYNDSLLKFFKPYVKTYSRSVFEKGLKSMDSIHSEIETNLFNELIFVRKNYTVIKETIVDENQGFFSASEQQIIEPTIPKKEEVLIYDDPDEPANFPGGMSAARIFITTNLNYPQNAKENGIEGKCYLKFIVSESGNISNIKVVRGVQDCPECDQEAIRLLKSMPKWEPGKVNGKPVHSTFTLPVQFKLN